MNGELSDTFGRLADNLRDLGYDIEPAQPGEPPGSSLVARRDLGERSIVVALDTGGRFRIDLTWVIGEWPSQGDLSGVPLRVVETVTRSTNLAGQVAQPEQLLAVLAALGEIVDWAAPPMRSNTVTEFPPPP